MSGNESAQSVDAVAAAILCHCAIVFGFFDEVCRGVELTHCPELVDAAGVVSYFVELLASSEVAFGIGLRHRHLCREARRRQTQKNQTVFFHIFRYFMLSLQPLKVCLLAISQFVSAVAEQFAEFVDRTDGFLLFGRNRVAHGDVVGLVDVRKHLTRKPERAQAPIDYA